MPSDGPTAFISYSRADSEFVLRMARDLKAAGAKVWLDQLDIEPGQRWARALQDAITNSPRFLVVLSPHSVDSTNVEDEVAFALEERKTIIPVLYCDCKVPFQLRPFQYADFRTDYEQGLRILLKTMGVDLPAGFTPSPVVERKALVVEEQANAAEKATQTAERVRLAQEQKAAEEEARLEEERKAAEKKRRDEKARKAAEEQARLETERKAAEAKATKDAEAKAAAEQARLERERKAAAERARKDAEAKAAADEETRLAAEETRKAKAAQSPSSVPVAVSPERDTWSEWSLGKKIGAVVFGVLFAILAYIFLFKEPSKPTPQPQPGRVRELKLKPKPEENQGVFGDETRPGLRGDLYVLKDEIASGASSGRW